MFLMDPDEQRRLLAQGPAATAKPTEATTQNHARARRKRSRFHHRRVYRTNLGTHLARTLKGV